MRRHLSTLVVGISLAAGGALVVACSAANESIGSSSAALSQTESGTFANRNLTQALTLTDFWGSSLPFSGGNLQFIPDTCGVLDLATALEPNGGALAPINVPSTVFSAGGCNWGLSVSALSTSAFSGGVPFGGAAPTGSTACEAAPAPATSGTLALTSSGIQFTIPLTGSANASAGNGGYCVWPSTGISISSGTVTLDLAWQASSQTFAANVTSNLNIQLTSSFDSSVTSALGVDFNAMIASTLTTQMNKMLTGPTGAQVTSAFYSVLAASLGLTPTGDTPWAVVPGSVAYDTTSEEFTFEASRLVPPPLPGCTIVSGCNSQYVPPGEGQPGTYYYDTVSTSCQSAPTAIEEQGAKGAWTTLPSFVPNMLYPSVPSANVYPISGAVGSPQNIRACTTDSTGMTSCDPVTAVTVASCPANDPLPPSSGGGSSCPTGTCAVGRKWDTATCSCVLSGTSCTSAACVCAENGGHWTGSICQYP